MKHRPEERIRASAPWESQLATLVACLEGLGMAPGMAQVELLAAYARLVVEWNRRLNLIARGDEAMFVRRHVGESAAFIATAPPPLGAHVVDIGSGAGLPGVPMKILRPDLRMVLVEAQRRRTLFLLEAIECLSLQGTEAVCARAEQLATRPEWQGRFQLVVARAVAPLWKLWRWAAPFLAQGGEVRTLKGGDLSPELQQLAASDPAARVRLTVPPACLVDPRAERVLVTIHRGAET